MPTPRWLVGLGVGIGVALAGTAVWATIQRRSTAVPHDHEPPPTSVGEAAAPKQGGARPEVDTLVTSSSRPPVDISDSDWSDRTADERVAVSTAAFERAMQTRPPDLEAAANALSLLRAELYPNRKDEYEQLERRYDAAQ